MLPPPDSNHADNPLSPTSLQDTIRWPGHHLDAREMPRLRPALAVLYRVAIGPGADYFAPKFLQHERAGCAAAGWHWPSLFLPSAWAFYRGLWFAGAAYAMLPLLAAWLFAAAAPRLTDSLALWLAGAAVIILVLPGMVSALLAHPLLHRRVAARVRLAEQRSGSVAGAASQLARRAPVSWPAAMGGAALAIIVLAAGVWPLLRGGYLEQSVRARLAEAVEAVRPLQREIEVVWRESRTIATLPPEVAQTTRVVATLLDDVSLNPLTGRLRLALGPAVPALWGKAILMAPALDADERIRWTCVPVDIPRRLLPLSCAD